MHNLKIRTDLRVDPRVQNFHPTWLSALASSFLLVLFIHLRADLRHLLKRPSRKSPGATVTVMVKGYLSQGHILKDLCLLAPSPSSQARQNPVWRFPETKGDFS